MNETTTPKTVTIPESEYRNLLRRDSWLGYLEAAGVDNWQGYDYAGELKRDAVEAGEDSYDDE